jgi:hypothetical protein
MLEELQAEKDEAAAQEAAAAAEEAGELEEEELPEDAMLEDEPLPDDIAPEDEGLMEDAPLEDAMPVKSAIVSDWEWQDAQAAEDMKRWQVKALHDFARKGRVYREFESGFIPIPEHARISAALAEADSVDAVKAAFKRDAVDTLLDDVDADARAWAEGVEDEN